MPERMKESEIKSSIPEVEWFTWKGLSVCQHEDVLKVGTDAILLGTWVPKVMEQPPHSILDAGTGSGILALMMAQCFPLASVEAVDHDPAACRLASFNVQQSIYADRINIIQANLLGNHAGLVHSADLVVSNPPYFFQQLQPERPVLRNAKHAQQPETEWTKGIMTFLRTAGSLCLIVPFDTAHRWIRAVNVHAMHCQHRLDVYSFERDLRPKRSLLHFRRDLRKPVISRMVLYNPDSTWTQLYQQWIGGQPPSVVPPGE